MTVHPASGRVIVGGSFTTMNGVTQYGMTSLDGVTGALMPWVVNTIIRQLGAEHRDLRPDHGWHQHLRHGLDLRRRQRQRELRGHLLGRRPHRRAQLGQRLPGRRALVGPVRAT